MSPREIMDSASTTCFTKTYFVPPTNILIWVVHVSCVSVLLPPVALNQNIWLQIFGTFRWQVEARASILRVLYAYVEALAFGAFAQLRPWF